MPNPSAPCANVNVPGRGLRERLQASASLALGKRHKAEPVVRSLCRAATSPAGWGGDAGEGAPTMRWRTASCQSAVADRSHHTGLIAPVRLVAAVDVRPTWQASLGVARAHGRAVARPGHPRDRRVLAAMVAVPRHAFVDEGLASRLRRHPCRRSVSDHLATSFVVARMSTTRARSAPRAWTHARGGAGCGYQAAVSLLATDSLAAWSSASAVRSIAHARTCGLASAQRRLKLADGSRLGLPEAAPNRLHHRRRGGELPAAGAQGTTRPAGRLIIPVGGVSSACWRSSAKATPS